MTLRKGHSRKDSRSATDFDTALHTLDNQMEKEVFLTTFAPIELISSGGYLAINFFKARESTQDLDYIIHPEWSDDEEIKKPFHSSIRAVAKIQGFDDDWMNDDMKEAPPRKQTKYRRTSIFEQVMAYEHEVYVKGYYVGERCGTIFYSLVDPSTLWEEVNLDKGKVAGTVRLYPKGGNPIEKRPVEFSYD
ncbi:hypothetical protein B7463_g2775, partial [Scytalidium lignicola]